MYVAERGTERLRNPQGRPRIKDYEGRKERGECFLCWRKGHLARDYKLKKDEEA